MRTISRRYRCKECSEIQAVYTPERFAMSKRRYCLFCKETRDFIFIDEQEIRIREEEERHTKYAYGTLTNRKLGEREDKDDT